MGDVSFGIVASGVASARSEEDVSVIVRLRGPEVSGMMLPCNYADLVVLCWVLDKCYKGVRQQYELGDKKGYSCCYGKLCGWARRTKFQAMMIRIGMETSSGIGGRHLSSIRRHERSWRIDTHPTGKAINAQLVLHAVIERAGKVHASS